MCDLTRFYMEAGSVEPSASLYFLQGAHSRGRSIHTFSLSQNAVCLQGFLGLCFGEAIREDPAALQALPAQILVCRVPLFSLVQPLHLSVPLPSLLSSAP